jgi:hypothetical protein
VKRIRARVAQAPAFEVCGSSSDSRFRIQVQTANTDFSACYGALSGLPEGRGFTGCGRTPPSCQSEPVRCHPDPAVAGEGSPHFAQGKLREGSRSEYFQRSARFLVVPIRSGLLGMTGQTGFPAACSAPPGSRLPPSVGPVARAAWAGMRSFGVRPAAADCTPKLRMTASTDFPAGCRVRPFGGS